MQYLEYKKIAKEIFFKELGVSSGNFRGEQANRPLNSNTIAKILAMAPDINTDWLITGDGPMLRKQLLQEETADGKVGILEIVREQSKKALAQMILDGELYTAEVMNAKNDLIEMLRNENKRLQERINVLERKKNK